MFLIKKTLNGSYTLEAICDEYGLNQRIEGVKITNASNGISITRSILDQDEWETINDFWNVTGGIADNRLRVIFHHEVNDSTVDFYDFLDGTKKN